MKAKNYKKYFYNIILIRFCICLFYILNLLVIIKFKNKELLIFIIINVKNKELLIFI